MSVFEMQRRNALRLLRPTGRLAVKFTGHRALGAPDLARLLLPRARVVTVMSDGTRPTRSGGLRMGRSDGSDPSAIKSIARGCLKIKVYTYADQRQNEFRVIIPNDS